MAAELQGFFSYAEGKLDDTSKFSNLIQRMKFLMAYQPGK